MARCTSTTNLTVHHKRRDGGNGLDNAEVLCSKCLSSLLKTEAGRVYSNTPLPFSLITEREALKRAGNRCECSQLMCNH